MLISEERDRLMRRFGVLYQSGALWSSMTLAENVSIPIEEYTDLNSSQIRNWFHLNFHWLAWLVSKSFIPPR